LHAARLYHPGLVFDLPLEMGERLDPAPALTAPIEEQLDFLEIGVHPDGHRLAQALCQVPVGEKMQHRLPAPPTLVIEEVVLREAAGVDDAELGVDGWPTVRSRLTAVIEARPGKPAGQVLARSIELPPLLGELRPGGMIHVVGTDPVAQRVGLIDPARANRAGGFGADERLPRITSMVGIDGAQVVVEALDVECAGYASAVGAVHCGGARPG